jgi:hypothetical protein
MGYNNLLIASQKKRSSNSEPRLQMSGSENQGPLVKNVRYLQLIRSIFMNPKEGAEACRTIALAAIGPQSGTSTIAASLGTEMTGYLGESAVIANSTDLRGVRDADPDAMIRNCRESQFPNLWQLKRATKQLPPDVNKKALSRSPGRIWVDPFSPDDLEITLRALNKSFGYVLVDCPSLSVSPEALILAPMVDGILLVIEADKTTKRQILRARKSIEMSGGKILGFVLNKRKYPIPDRIYSWLF